MGKNLGNVLLHGTVTFYAGNVCPSAPQRFTSQVLSKKVQLTGNPRYFMY